VRALVIGGTGFIGSSIVRRLSAGGHAVAIFHRGKTRAGQLQAHEFRDPSSTLPIQKFPKELFEFDPEIVVHTFAMGAADADAAVRAFAGRIQRIVLLSSGDVYRAYGRFTGLEPGPIEPGLLSEESPLRSVHFPYRSQAASPDSLQYWYEKILAEQAVMQGDIPWTVLRLPKVYGRGNNANLATVYAYRNHPSWRWTHGYVENVADAVVLAATSPAAANRVYNVGEADTPTVAERLPWMPVSAVQSSNEKFNFEQDIAYDTSRVRNELGYCEVIPEREAMLRTLEVMS